ncbi:hypothetical protein HNQ93_000214 [Hymenobacter luteus]|uniref:Uncharacterized protein n=2 Tax=Hymenobacter TaxID=89966 RepID=A0A7W9W986_9BACT|nr:MULTISPECIES: hypothetical protein [Hymenobacter]MBB4600306.1 hypothetical protein [Hymenobacter latericoloratus]MBB6057384.1 hypothetical protein [Hymenobacter luteus]
MPTPCGGRNYKTNPEKQPTKAELLTFASLSDFNALMHPNSTRIRLQPANTQRIPFLGQLFLGLLWIGYTVALIVTGEGASDMHFLHYVFLVFSLIYLGYVLVHNAPVFGTQSYLEFTPAYIVHKDGLFRPKQAFPAEGIASLELVPQQLRLLLKEGGTYAMSLRQVKGAKRKRLMREQVRAFAAKHNIDLRDTQA